MPELTALVPLAAIAVGLVFVITRAEKSVQKVAPPKSGDGAFHPHTMAERPPPRAMTSRPILSDPAWGTRKHRLAGTRPGPGGSKIVYFEDAYTGQLMVAHQYDAGFEPL